MGITRQYEVDWTTPDYVEGEDPPGAIKKLDENQQQIFAEADKIRKHYAGTSAPENPEVGLIWQDTSTDPPTLRRWDGTAWDDLKVAVADKVDGYDVSQTPAGNTIPVADGDGHINSWINQGEGSGLDADLLRGLPADFTCSKNQNGYTKLPNGLIIQWGKNYQGTITLPITFPNTFFAVVVTLAHTSTTPSAGIDAHITNNSSFTAYYGGSGSDYIIYWIAIGY